MEIVLQSMSGCDVGVKEAVINSGHAGGLQHLPAEAQELEQEHEEAASQHRDQDGIH